MPSNNFNEEEIKVVLESSQQMINKLVLLLPRHEREDVAQDANLAIFQFLGAKRWDPSKAALSTLMWKIARNKVYDHLRRFYKRKKFFSRIFAFCRALEEKRCEHPADGIMEAEFREKAIKIILDKGGPVKAEVLKLMLEGKNGMEIAGILGLLEPRVSRIKSKIRNILRLHLD